VDGAPGQLPIESAARYVEDVNRDPVVIFDGSPRTGATRVARHLDVAPEKVIEAVASAGSSWTAAARGRCNGGHPAAERRRRAEETLAINAAFRDKRDRMIQRLERMASAPIARRTAPLRLGNWRGCRRRSTRAWASSARRGAEGDHRPASSSTHPGNAAAAGVEFRATRGSVRGAASTARGSPDANRTARAVVSRLTFIRNSIQ